MANFELSITADDHGLGKELDAHAIELPEFIKAEVIKMTAALYESVRRHAPTRGDRPRWKWESKSHTARGASWQAGNLRDAVEGEVHTMSTPGAEGKISINEAKAPYAKYVVFPTSSKDSAKLMVFPARNGSMAGHHFNANPTNDFPLKGLNAVDIHAHVERLAQKAGNLPRL
jgi:hypothetical protein